MSRFKHGLSNYKLTSGDMGKLIPIGCVEVLPGDSIQHQVSLLLRVSPLVTPVMHPVVVRVHSWLVPNRIVWDDWQEFITGYTAAGAVSSKTFPTITFNNAAVGSLADYYDVPSAVASDRAINALPFRGYAKCYNDFYRDEDLVTPLTIDTSDGVDTTTNTTLQSIAWEKDRFTSARPWTQKGTAVSLSLGTSAVVKGASSDLLSGTQNAVQFKLAATGNSPTAQRAVFTAAANDRIALDSSSSPGGGLTDNLYPSNLYADLSDATAAEINDIRWAMALQRYKENAARYGSRYVEWLQQAFNVRSSDARLQLPEYLGGGKVTIQFSEVVQQAPTTSGTPGTGVGVLRGHGISSLRSNRYRKFIEEHGFIHTFLSVRPKSVYANGIPKHLLRTAKEDFWTRELEHVGQEEIYNKEVYSGDSGPDDVFGYQDRYDTYRREESRVSGEQRTSTLNMWNLARLFASDVTLNGSFITCDPAESRILQSTATDSLQIMAHHSIQSRRVVSPVGNSFVL